jgi:hypothetical protein
VAGAAKKSGKKKPGMVVHTCNLSTREADAGGLRVQGQPGLHRPPSQTKNREQIRTGIRGSLDHSDDPIQSRQESESELKVKIHA